MHGKAGQHDERPSVRHRSAIRGASGHAVIPEDTLMPQHVYVVDDDESMREAIAGLLESVGYSTSLFSNPQDLLDTLPAEPIGCMILDIRLPRISGLDLQRRLGERGITLPIIFVTGHGDIPMCVQAMKAGAYEFLVKPFRAQDLLDAVAGALEHFRQVQGQRSDIEILTKAYASLSRRERDVMARVVDGWLNKVIAADLGLSEVTVKVYRSKVLQKMGASSVAELARFAERLGGNGQPG